MEVFVFDEYHPSFIKKGHYDSYDLGQCVKLLALPYTQRILTKGQKYVLGIVVKKTVNSNPLSFTEIMIRTKFGHIKFNDYTESFDDFRVFKI